MIQLLGAWAKADTGSLRHAIPSTAFGLVRWKASDANVPKRASFPGDVVESMKLQDGKRVYASVTVTLQPPGRLGMQKGITAVVTATWELVRSFFKGERPHVLLMYTSLGKPLARTAAKQLSRVANHGYDVPVVVAGCSASRWRPEGERTRVGIDQDAHRAHHFSVTAAHLPDIAPYAFTSDTDSLPSLPMLEEALGPRPPQFMLFTHPTNQYGAHQSNLLMKRFENIFPDSNIFGVVADYINPKERATFVQNGVALRDLPASGSPNGALNQSVAVGRRRKAPARPGTHASEADHVCRASSSSLNGNRPSASGSPFVNDDDAPGSLLFVSDASGTVHVLEKGSVGVALYPQTSHHRLPPKSVLNLVRVMAGGFRFETSNKLLLSERVQQLMSPLHGPAATPHAASGTRNASLSSPSQQEAVPSHSPPVSEDEAVGSNAELRADEGSGTASCLSASMRDVHGVQKVAAFISPKGIHGQGSKKIGPPAQQAMEVPMFVLADVSLFPDQALELKVFEPRYQLLVRQCLEQEAPLGISHSGVGTLARITSCRPAVNGHCIVEVLGRGRFSYVANSARVLPACFGLTVAQVRELQDDAPGPEYKGPTCDLAIQALQLLLHEWVLQLRKRSFVESSAAALAASEDLSRAKQIHATLSAGYQRTSIIMTDGAVEMKKKVVEEMDVQQAATVSLWLGGLLSNSLVPQYMRREWLSSQNTYQRLGQQVQLLNQNYQIRREAVLALMRQTSHPLRSMLAIF